MQNAAAKGFKNMRQLSLEPTESATRRDHRIALVIKRCDTVILCLRAGVPCSFVRAEHTREGAVNYVSRAAEIRMHGNANIVAIGPVLLAVGIERVCLGLEPANLGERHRDRPAVHSVLHGHITPTRFQLHFRFLNGLNDTPPQLRSAPDVCTYYRTMSHRHIAQREPQSIAHVPNKALATGRVHGHCRHVGIMLFLFFAAHKKGGPKPANIEMNLVPVMLGLIRPLDGNTDVIGLFR